MAKNIAKLSAAGRGLVRGKIAFFETEPWEKKYLKKRLKDYKLYFYPEVINKKALKSIQDIDILSPFIYSKIN